MSDSCNSNPVTYKDFPRQLTLSNEERDSIMVQIIDILLTSDLPNMNLNIACGIAGNIKSESEFNYTTLGDNGTSYGLCQWHDPDRMTKLFDYCKKIGKPRDSVEGQVQFLINELKTNKSTAYEAISANGVSDDAGKVATQFCLKFEVPANRDTVCPKRAANARYVLQKYQQLKGQSS